jgi:hypothetical protein
MGWPPITLRCKVHEAARQSSAAVGGRRGRLRQRFRRRRALAHAVDQRGAQEKGAVRDRIGGGSPQRRVRFCSHRRVLLLESLLVGDGLLLHVFDVQRTAKAVVLIEDDITLLRLIAYAPP